MERVRNGSFRGRFEGSPLVDEPRSQRDLECMSRGVTDRSKNDRLVAKGRGGRTEKIENQTDRRDTNTDGVCVDDMEDGDELRLWKRRRPEKRRRRRIHFYIHPNGESF